MVAIWLSFYICPLIFTLYEVFAQLKGSISAQRLDSPHNVLSLSNAIPFFSRLNYGLEVFFILIEEDYSSVSFQTNSCFVLPYHCIASSFKDTPQEDLCASVSYF